MKPALFRLVAWGAFLLLWVPGFAHSPRETYAHLSLEEGQLQIRLELPWAFRQAVFQRFPELEDQPSRAQLEARFRDYLREYVQVWQGGEPVAPTAIEMADGSHSHSLSVTMGFPASAGNAAELVIENRLLFNLFAQATNQHEWRIPGQGTASSTTTPDNPSFAPWARGSASAPARRATQLLYSLLFVSLMAGLAFWQQGWRPLVGKPAVLASGQ
jgi:hypothetical protein